MKRITKYALMVLGLLVFASARAHAWNASEVDPSLAVSGFSLLAGSLVILRAKFRGKTGEAPRTLRSHVVTGSLPPHSRRPISIHTAATPERSERAA